MTVSPAGKGIWELVVYSTCFEKDQLFPAILIQLAAGLGHALCHVSQRQKQRGWVGHVWALDKEVCWHSSPCLQPKNLDSQHSLCHHTNHSKFWVQL